MTESQSQKRFRRSRPLLILLPIVSAIICIGIGRYYVSPSDAMSAIWQFLTGNPTGVGSTEFSVIINLRLPRILLAIVAGAALTSAGCAFQAVFSNPLAAPDTLGVSAGAALGACVGLLIGLPSLAVQLLAFGGGVLAVTLTFWVNRSRLGGSSIALVLSGIAVAAIFQAGTSLTQMMADPNKTLPEITYWLMGSLSRASYTGILLALPAALGGILCLRLLRWRLNTLSLDEHEAASLGVPVKKIRTIVVISATLCTATAVSLSGMVGWLGILAPHIARMVFGSDNRYVLPAGISFGATALILMDTLARNLVPGELPISVLTALVGAPIFILLLRRTGGARL